MRDSFEIFNLNKDTATKDELYTAYRAAIADYEFKRFEPGEVGTEACEKLDEFKKYYNDCKQSIDVREAVNTQKATDEQYYKSADTQSYFTGGNAYNRSSNSQSSSYGAAADFNSVSALIKKSDLDSAQKELNSISGRTAEWHYLQSVIYYKRHWTAESKQELNLAVEMEPTNPKYSSAYRKMSAQGAQNGNGSYTYGSGQQGGEKRSYQADDWDNYDNRRSYRNESDYRRGSSTNTACNCCTALCCADTCCECMGGDCITCC
ncbi:MAG: hypothetical protein LBN25_01830 [Christensenellaceae bacterium]|jgi:hypothetical protein|nr:hypothetical protein [Christensenellaceae bacterium]